MKLLLYANAQTIEYIYITLAQIELTISHYLISPACYLWKVFLIQVEESAIDICNVFFPSKQWSFMLHAWFGQQDIE